MSRRRFVASLSTLLCIAPFLEGVVVTNATELNNAIIAANGGGDNNSNLDQALTTLNSSNLSIRTMF